MDVRFINPFITAVKDLFETMLSVKVSVGKPFIKQCDEPIGDVSAIIGMSGDVVGSVILCFPMSTATKAASTFTGMEIGPSHEDFSDALGELANIVAGGAKAQFEGVQVSISLPSVVIGTNHIIPRSRLTPRLSIPCESNLGRFFVDVSMVIEKKRTPPNQPAVAATRS